ncbi:acyl carrier protein [Streptomyces sulphureus]|uniref:acyl carrier protein n=1 Tax=Streptomyces sulphureus TaxID=47758 RepID=UPI0003625F43|nr:acyl carrier protein [Streptomyces sulphureus]
MTANDLNARLRRMPEAERERILLDVVMECTATVLGYHEPDALEPDMDFPEAGVDSLTAVEIRSRIAARIGVPVPRARFRARTTFAESAKILAALVAEAEGAPVRP